MVFPALCSRAAIILQAHSSNSDFCDSDMPGKGKVLNTRVLEYRGSVLNLPPTDAPHM